MSLNCRQSHVRKMWRKELKRSIQKHQAPIPGMSYKTIFVTLVTQFWKDACQVQTYPENFRDTLCTQMDHSSTRRGEPGSSHYYIYSIHTLCLLLHTVRCLNLPAGIMINVSLPQWSLTNMVDHIFVGDTVDFQDPGHRSCYGKVVKFITEVDNEWLLLSCA